MAINLDAESIREEAFDNPEVWNEHAALIEGLPEEVIDTAIRECVDDHFRAAFDSTRSAIITRLIADHQSKTRESIIRAEPTNTAMITETQIGRSAVHDRVTDIIDRVKTDERNLDTDEYVGMLLDVFDAPGLQLIWVATVAPWTGVDSSVSTTVHVSAAEAWTSIRDNHDPEGDLASTPNEELGQTLGLTILVEAHEVPTS